MKIATTHDKGDIIMNKSIFKTGLFLMTLIISNLTSAACPEGKYNVSHLSKETIKSFIDSDLLVIQIDYQLIPKTHNGITKNAWKANNEISLFNGSVTGDYKFEKFYIDLVLKLNSPENDKYRPIGGYQHQKGAIIEITSYDDTTKIFRTKRHQVFNGLKFRFATHWYSRSDGDSVKKIFGIDALITMSKKTKGISMCGPMVNTKMLTLSKITQPTNEFYANSKVSNSQKKKNVLIEASATDDFSFHANPVNNL